MKIDRVTGDGWWRIFRFAALTHPRARNGDYRKHPSQSVTRHLTDARVTLPPAFVGRAVSCNRPETPGVKKNSESTP